MRCKTVRVGSDDWEISHQDACDADKLTGLEDFGVLLRPLGLTEKKPVPDPIAFTEPDPLGALVYSSADTMRAAAHKGIKDIHLDSLTLKPVTHSIH